MQHFITIYLAMFKSKFGLMFVDILDIGDFELTAI